MKDSDLLKALACVCRAIAHSAAEDRTGVWEEVGKLEEMRANALIRERILGPFKDASP